jgi:hypothetical protein
MGTGGEEGFAMCFEVIGWIGLGMK